MARPPSYERRNTDLQCPRCGHTFRREVLWVSHESSDRGRLGWTVGPLEGLACPACKSDVVVLAGH